MGSRLISSASTIHPWPFPALDGNATPAPRPKDAVNGVAYHAPEAAPEPQPVAPETPPFDPQAAAALAEEQAAEGYAEGLRRGFAEGQEQGYAAGLAEAKAAEQRFAEQAQRLIAIIDRLGAPIAALQRPVEEAVAALALEVARGVIGSEVSRSHEYLVRLISEAVSKVPIHMGAPKILLNPTDLDMVRALAPEIGKGGAALVADEGIEAGGCIVVADGDDEPIEDRRWHARTGEGVSQVDLTLSSRWRSVIFALFEGDGD